MPNQVMKYVLKLNDVRRIHEDITRLESSSIQEWIWNATSQEIKYFNLLRSKLKTY